MVTAALLPLLIVRCDRRPGLVAEAVNELAARMVEPAARTAGAGGGEPVAATCGVAGPSRPRRPWLAGVRCRTRADVGDRRPATAASRPSAVDRLALQEFRRRLGELPEGREAWDVLVGSAAQVWVVVDGAVTAGHAPAGAAAAWPRRAWSAEPVGEVASWW